jgi:hypothetical protein
MTGPDNLDCPKALKHAWGGVMELTPADRSWRRVRASGPVGVSRGGDASDNDAVPTRIAEVLRLEVILGGEACLLAGGLLPYHQWRRGGWPNLQYYSHQNPHDNLSQNSKLPFMATNSTRGSVDQPSQPRFALGE